MKPSWIMEDTTLRDGEQAPGVAFDLSAKLQIYHWLVQAGIQWLEVGIPAMEGEELEAVKVLRQKGEEDGVTTVAWNRGVKQDVEQSLGLGFKAVHIGLPTSTLHLQQRIGKSRQWLLSQASDLIKLAKDQGAFVSISAEDVGRTDPHFLQEYAHQVTQAGADRLRLSDTVGILSPEAYVHIIQQVQAVSSIDIQCHAHNDYGLAMINTLEALKAGARFFHVTVNGIGERAGMADLSQMAMLLQHVYGVDLGIRLDALRCLSRVVSFYTKSPLYPWQPVVGDNLFSHESGIHVDGTLKCGETFEPFPPELVQGERRIVIGKHSGRNALRFTLERLGESVDENLLPACLQEVRALSIVHRSSLSDAQLLSLYRKIVKASKASLPSVA